MNETVSNNAYEYLYATIQMADWIDDGYKKLAEQYREHEALKELYLCMCDGVSLDLLEVLVIENGIEEMLQKCRKKHLESDFLRKYSDVVERISVITAKTEHEVKNMSTTVKYIADSMPIKSEKEGLPEPIIISDVIRDFESEETQETEADTKIDITEPIVTATPILSASNQNSLKDKLFKPIATLVDKYKGNPKRTVIDMISKGYTVEQINFIYSCIEEGMTAKEIDKFASPKISLETMQQLKKVVLKEREKNG